MKIETKFDIYDCVYIMRDNKITELEINRITTSIEFNDWQTEKRTIYYSFKEESLNIEENDLYGSKEELIQELLKQD